MSLNGSIDQGNNAPKIMMTGLGIAANGNTLFGNTQVSAFKSDQNLPCNQLKTKISYSDTLIPLMDRFLLEWEMDKKGAAQDLDFMDLHKMYAGYLGVGSVSPSFF